MNEELNPSYEDQQARVAKHSTTYHFQMALKALKDEAFTAQLFQKYYGISVNERLSQ